MMLKYEANWEPPTKGYPYHRINVGTWCAKIRRVSCEDGQIRYRAEAGERHSRPRRRTMRFDTLQAAMDWATTAIVEMHDAAEHKRWELGR